MHNEEPEHIIPVEGFDIRDTGAATERRCCENHR